MRLTLREWAALRHLDWCCWEDCESDGDGWCDTSTFISGFGVKYAWGSQLLNALVHRGVAETRRTSRKQYALTEKGAEMLAGAGHRPQAPRAQSEGTK